MENLIIYCYYFLIGMLGEKIYKYKRVKLNYYRYRIFQANEVKKLSDLETF